MKGLMAWVAALLAAAVVVAWSPAARAADTSPTSPTAAIAAVAALDGQTVRVTGEVVGDVMLRAGGAWLNVGDGNTALGVWATPQQAARVTYAGGYLARGDTVEVTGVLHRACPQHGGDLDLHATRLEVLTTGGRLSRPVDRARLGRGFGLLLAGLAAAALALRPGRRPRPR